MYLSRIELRRDIHLSQLGQLLSKDGYRAHQQLWRLFSDENISQRDFLYRDESGTAWPCFYTLSQRLPEDPQQLWQIASKPFAPQLQAGQPLQFSLRVNPIVTRSDNGHQRHDVVMDAKTRWRNEQGEATMSSDIKQNLLQQAGWNWLAKRATQYGFSVKEDQVYIDGYRQHRLYKNNAKLIRLSTLDYQGLLQITDPELFWQTLCHGIGPAKGFGCGLMLLRRVGL